MTAEKGMSQPSPGETLRALRAHGANPEKLYAALGIPMPADVIDFSTNACALPWPDEAVGRAIDTARLASAYPDDECLALRRLIAAREGLALENVLVTNGSNEALYLLASFFVGRRAAVLQPSYGEYARALRAFGAEVEDVFSLDSADRADLLILSNPCNPTGAYLPLDELARFAADRPNTTLAVDEAYIDFLLTREREGLDLSALPNVLLLRSLTKTYHLSGARIGYVLAGEGWIRRLGSRQPTWSVNAFAQALALAFVEDEGFLARLRTHYAEETPRLVRAVEAAGFRVRPSCVHYFLMETEDDEALIRGLMERGIVVRHTRNFPGLEGRCVRIATRTRQEDQRLADVLRELRERGVCR